MCSAEAIQDQRCASPLIIRKADDPITADEYIDGELALHSNLILPKSTFVTTVVKDQAVSSYASALKKQCEQMRIVPRQ